MTAHPLRGRSYKFLSFFWSHITSYLEAGYIFSARIFLSHFLSLILTAQPSILQRTIPGPIDGGESTKDEIFITTLPALNFLQLLIRTCQVGPGTPVTPIPTAAGAGMGKAAFQALVGKYERYLSWLKTLELKEVRAPFNKNSLV
jgi:golgi to ER traffic protein 4